MQFLVQQQHHHVVYLQPGLLRRLYNGSRAVTCRNMLQNVEPHAETLEEVDSWAKLISIQQQEYTITYSMYGLEVSNVVAFELLFHDVQGAIQRALTTNSQELQLAVNTVAQIYVFGSTTK